MPIKFLSKVLFLETWTDTPHYSLTGTPNQDLLTRMVSGYSGLHLCRDVSG